jgi:6-phosphogluconolactonase
VVGRAGDVDVAGAVVSHDVRIGAIGEINAWLSAELTAAAERASPRMSIALAGGSVATECFPALSRLPLDWSRACFVWADERAVPPDDPESNFRIASERWFEPAGVPASSILRMPGDREDLDAAAAAYEQTVKQALGPSPVLDLSLLGMGPDGHIASLFPGHPLLDVRDRLVAAIVDSPKPPPRRLTLTLPMLTATRRTILIALGASKAESLHAALTDPACDLPVAQLLRDTPWPLVLADSEAGRLVGMF